MREAGALRSFSVGRPPDNGEAYKYPRSRSLCTVQIEGMKKSHAEVRPASHSW